MVQDLFVKGLNYKSAVAWSSISTEQLDDFRQSVSGNKDLVLLNTCNRIDLYGFDEKLAQELLMKHFGKTVYRYTYTKKSHDAVEHLFNVACGLDSQLVGEFEILGQFRKSFQDLRNQNLLGSYLERLANICIQSAKEIRSSTKLTNGTTSLSYATIELLREKKLQATDNVLLIGAGTFASSIARNIKSYFPKNQITITNRTQEKAYHLANEVNGQILDFSKINEHLSNFDVIIAAIPSPYPGLMETLVESSNDYLLVDLSAPAFFKIEGQLPQNVNLLTLTDASEIVTHSVNIRKASIPAAKAIIARHMHEFNEWSKIYQQSDTIKEWKAGLSELSTSCPHIHAMSDEEKEKTIKKSVSRFVKYLKCNSEEALNKEDVYSNYLNGEVKSACAFHSEISKDDSCRNCHTCQK